MTKKNDEMERLFSQLQALESGDWDILLSRTRAARRGREQGGVLLPAKEAHRLRDFFLEEGVRVEPRAKGVVWAQFPMETRFLFSCMHVTLPTGKEFVVVPRGAAGKPGGSGREVFRLPHRAPKVSASTKPSRKRRQKLKA